MPRSLLIPFDDPHLSPPPPAREDKDTHALDRLIGQMLVTDHEGSPTPAAAFRVSAVAREPCKRFLVMAVLFPGEDRITSQQAAIYDDGTWRHLRIQAWAERLQKHGWATVHGIEQVVVAPRFMLSGHIDVSLTFLTDPLKRLGPTLLELKGIYGKGFEALTAPYRSHYLQALLYLTLKKFKASFIVYENKDNQARKIFKVKPHTGEVRIILTRLAKLMEYATRAKAHLPRLRRGDLPPPEIAAWCGSCPQKRRCFALHDEGI
jgi:hypothetical protein